MAKMVSTPLGIQKRKATTKRKKKVGFWKKVVDYLLSDTYMYAPLISSTPPGSTTKAQTTSPSKGSSLGYLERAIAATTPTKNASGEHRQTKESPASLSEREGLINRVLPGADDRNPSPIRRQETVKHMVHFSAHTLSNLDQGVEKKKVGRPRKPVQNDFVTTRSKQDKEVS